MHQPNSPAPEAVLRSYFRAKDENRPHLLEEVFASGAELVIRNQSVRVGCGTYVWAFEPHAPRVANRLAITIVAERMGTIKSAISRLESAGKHAPSLATLKRYASADRR